MPGPTTESLATDFRDVMRELVAVRSDIASFREDYAGFRGRVETQFQFMKWPGGFVATILVSLIASGFWLAWEASALNQRVGSMEKTTLKVVDRVDSLEKTTAKVVDRVDSLEKTTAKVVDRVDTLEKTTARVVDRLEQELGPAKNRPMNR